MKNLLIIASVIAAFVIAGCSDDDNKVRRPAIEVLNAVNDTIYVKKGETVQLQVRTNPDKATVTYESNNLFYCEVDAEGVVTGIQGGFCRLYIYATSGTQETFRKQIIVGTHVDMTELKASAEYYVIAPDATLNLSSVYTYEPADALFPKLKFTSSDPGVITVDEDNKTVTVSKGKAVITGTAQDDSGLSIQIPVYVDYVDTNIPTASWPVTGSSVYSTLLPVYQISNATDDNTSTYWRAKGGSTAAATDPQWLLLDAGSAVTFNRFYSRGYQTKTVKIYTHPSTEDGLTQDAEGFVHIGDIVFSANGVYRDLTFSPDQRFSSRYFKFVLPDGLSTTTLGLYEMEIHIVE